MIRLLLDQGIPRRAVTRLQDRGFTARHVADNGLERAPDLDILQAARDEGECVLTLDADFHSHLAVSGAESPSVVRIRWEGLRSAEIAARIDAVDPSLLCVLMTRLEGVEKVDYIISLHSEQDHSGGLPAVMERYPQAQLLASPKGKEMLSVLLPIPAENIRAVQDRIQAACDRAGRDPASVSLVAVAKTHPAEAVQAAAACGLTLFGENKVQEAKAKIPQCPFRLRWQIRTGHPAIPNRNLMQQPGGWLRVRWWRGQRGQPIRRHPGAPPQNQ